MTATLDREQVDLEQTEAAPPDTAADATDLDRIESGPGEESYFSGPVLRPLAVALLTSGAAGLMAGGIFGSWTARLIACGGAAFGVGWAYFCVRATKNRVLKQSLIFPAAFLLGIFSLIPTTHGPAKMFALIGDAISSGRLLRPPVPFDPGWRPVLIVLMASIGFAGGWVALGLRRPQLALVLPLPILGLSAISQPAEGEFIAGLLGFIPILLALTLLFGGDMKSVSELGAAFEIKRAIKSAPLVAGGVLLVVLLSQTDFLFPKPVYNPAQKPQKPKAIPLGQVRDRVLFSIDGTITGPWKAGVLDFYDGASWRLPPYDVTRLKTLASDGVIDKTRVGDVTVKFTIGDLGTTSVFPGLSGPTKINISGLDVVYDPRSGTFRLPVGRVPQGQVYEMSLPTYPTAEQLQAAGPVTTKIDRDLTYIPKPTLVVQRLLAEAPSRNLWDRLDYVRKKLNDVVIAAGAGVPSKPVPLSKVDDLLEGSHEGTPFEIVAAEAMLARWAGMPSRIGYGFDGFNDEDGKKTIRPKNGSNWLEVYFEGYGWVPLIGTPPKAKASLDTDPNARFNQNITPSDDVAVELYVITELENLRQLYERIRALILQATPFLLAALAIYLGLPSIRRGQRRRKRRSWARREGFRQEVAVEYAEFRDGASDLNVGDPNDTPLEYLFKVVADDRHSELAWLVTRSMYGDMRDNLTKADAEAARDMAASLRKRMLRAQPFQSRVLGILSRASLREPYTAEVPNVRLLKLRRVRQVPAQKKPGIILPPTRRVRFARAARNAAYLGRKS